MCTSQSSNFISYVIETPNGEVITFDQEEWDAFTLDHGHPPDYFI